MRNFLTFISQSTIVSATTSVIPLTQTALYAPRYTE